jgi:hypothetical protein
MPRYVHDQRTGAGYGSLSGRGFQNKPSLAGARFPYNDDPSSEEEEEELSDEMRGTRAGVGAKLNYSNIAREPSTSSRHDYFTMAKNRLDLAESDSPRTTLSGMVPFPLQRFDGPVVGGMSDNPSYTVAPGRIDGSPYGWTKGVMMRTQKGQDAPPRFMDAIDPEIRNKVSRKLKISRLKQ